MSDPVTVAGMASAIATLASAAFALVDAAKLGPKGGVSQAGFGFVEKAVALFLPPQHSNPAIVAANARVLDVLHGLWINGAPIVEQKAVAKSLLKLRLAAHTAGDFAAATGVESGQLAAVAGHMDSGTAFNEAQANAHGRFDVELSAVLDAAYQHADQRYRNLMRVLALGLSTLLALHGGWALAGDAPYFGTEAMWRAVLCGVLAAPLAPVAKDGASLLAAAAKLVQTWRH